MTVDVTELLILIFSTILNLFHDNTTKLAQTSERKLYNKVASDHQAAVCTDWEDIFVFWKQTSVQPLINYQIYQRFQNGSMTEIQCKGLQSSIKYKSLM